jgi:DNA ligase-1
LVKIKEIKDCDLIVVGWEKGTGRNSHRMGNLILETSDKKLRVSVGTGFSDLQRDEKPVIGKIAAIQYNAVINKKNSSTKSLFLPRFIEYREDKTTADSLNDLI